MGARRNPPLALRRLRARSFRLQFFAEERTEPATPRKRQKSREEGRMAKSQDLSAAVVIIAGLVAVYSLGLMIWGKLVELFHNNITHISSALMREEGWLIRPALEGFRGFFWGWLPVGIICAFMAAVIMIYQVGFLVSAKPLTPKPDRFNPVSGLKKIVSMRTLVELAKGLLKAMLLMGMLVFVIRKEQDTLLSVMLFQTDQGVAIVMKQIFSLSLKMALVLLALGFADYAYQKWDFEKSIRMSKQEIKDEYKQMEGDPLIKRRIRQKQRELARGRMMADVPKADVVVTNPTQIAVAIQYDQRSMTAPTVIAKGEGFVAQKIRDIAKEHKIPIIENKPLARALLLQVEIGEMVPQELYRSVAEVLAFVYRLKSKG